MGRNGKCKHQRNCAFNFKRKRIAWNKIKDKTLTLDTQVNLTESDKGSFYNQKEWLEECEYGKGMFYNEYGQKQPPGCSAKKGVLRNFTKFTGRHLCQSLIFNNVAGLRPVTLLKTGLWHKCFSVHFQEFPKFPRTPFLQNTSGRLLLYGDDIWTSASIFAKQIC